LPAFYAKRFQWHGNRPPEPTPPSVITDDKLDLSSAGLHDLLHIAERLRVKIKHRHTDEVADSCRLRKAPQIALLHRHRILCVHHAGPRDHGLSKHNEAAASHFKHCCVCWRRQTHCAGERQDRPCNSPSLGTHHLPIIPIESG
jgi:hypothetical protein